MDKERSGQIDINEFNLKILGKEVVGEVELGTYLMQEFIKDKVVMTRRHHDVLKNPRHGNKVAYA